MQRELVRVCMELPKGKGCRVEDCLLQHSDPAYTANHHKSHNWKQKFNSVDRGAQNRVKVGQMMLWQQESPGTLCLIPQPRVTFPNIYIQCDFKEPQRHAFLIPKVAATKSSFNLYFIGAVSLQRKVY